MVLLQLRLRNLSELFQHPLHRFLRLPVVTIMCFPADKIVLEFQHYAPGSRWRQTTVSRKGHRETGDETDGFYGGIRKLRSKDEITTWRRFWPVDVLS
jgi:hypothetical protein